MFESYARISYERKAEYLGRELTEEDMIRLCRGISPADIKSMFEISQTEAVTDDRLVKQVDLMRVKIELISKGKQRLSSRYSREDLDRRVAVHEVGHVILAKHFGEYLEGVNILGLANSLGVTVQSIEEGSELRTVRELLEQVCVHYGGVINEYLYYGKDMKNVSMGCGHDISVATNILNYVIYSNSLINTDSLLLNYESIEGAIQMNYTDIIKETSIKCNKITEEILKANKEISDKLVEILVDKKEVSSIELERFFKDNEITTIDIKDKL